jgi:hypothetical protein
MEASYGTSAKIDCNTLSRDKCYYLSSHFQAMKSPIDSEQSDAVFLLSKAPVAILVVTFTVTIALEMSEPQLSIRSAKAKELAHAFACHTDPLMNKLVE